VIQFKILSGKKAGTACVARRFPVRIGRGPNADLQLEEDGVWDNHLRLDLSPAEGVILRTQTEGPARVNGKPVDHVALRNGDTIEIGSVRLQFWLGETQQGALRIREWLTWVLIGLISLAQIGLIYWLLR
jgi:pSer/pThr/pTyr-binding forkhead associated (FHA) protein